MRRPRGRNGWVFAGCSAAVIAAMSWVSYLVIDLDARSAAAQADRDHQVVLSQALWRMDSWFAPQLAQEAARPYTDFQAYATQQEAYTNLSAQIERGAVRTPSPLLSFRSKVFRLHFQFEGEGALTSPQVPVGNWMDLTQDQLGKIVDLERPKSFLAKLRTSDVGRKIRAAIGDLGAASTPTPDATPRQESETVGPQRFNTDFKSRARAQQVATRNNRTNVDVTARVDVGHLRPLWIRLDPAASESWLVFVREVKIGPRRVFQGVLADWQVLRQAFLDEIADLFVGRRVSLERREPGQPVHESEMLATVPARLVAELPVAAAGISPSTSVVLWIAWVGLLVALVAVGFALRSTSLHGERRARFASAVTHELRTPLTTFRMYSEMLAEDMVRDPAQRQEYLETLRGEADRLSRLVENVLSYARIEEGRFNARPEQIGLRAMMDRIEPLLARRAQETGQPLDVRVTNGVEVSVDVDAVAQILFNLVDNACKYAGDSGIEIEAGPREGGVVVTVADRGPGIPARAARAVFQPFEQLDHTPKDPAAPGVGLGLALARALAEDLGGTLKLESAAVGARFVLWIPVA